MFILEDNDYIHTYVLSISKVIVTKTIFNRVDTFELVFETNLRQKLALA
jgi:hypothetical protein